MMRQGQGLPISTIIIAALGLLVLVVIAAIFGSQITQVGAVTRECQYRCAGPAGPFATADIAGALENFERDPASCNDGFEKALAGQSFFTQDAPQPGMKYICKACCAPI